jgi:phosphatidate cytidylyltransferase
MVRFVTGAALAVTTIAAILFLPVSALRVIAMVVAALAAHEYLGIAGTAGMARRMVAIALTVVACAAIALQAAIDPIAVMLGALAWVAVEVLAAGRRIHEVAADVMSPLYVGVPLGMLVTVHVLEGPAATLLIVALVIVSDSAQYYSGRAFGRHALAPAISPKKTVEGAIGGVIGVAAFMALAGPRVIPAPPMVLAAMGVVMALLGIAGDLFESKLKREAHVKDSSSLIPGHGGVLDRIDALLFVTPAFALFVGGYR